MRRHLRLQRNFVLLAILISSISFIFFKTASSDWEKCGGPYGGRSKTILVMSDNVVFSLGINLFRSIDNAETWERAAQIGGSVLFEGPDRFLYAGDYSLSRSTDDGVTWAFCGNGMSSAPIYCMAQNQNGEMFIGTGPYVSLNPIMYRSIDTGKTWTSILQPNIFGNTEVRHIAISSGYGTIFIAGNASGILRSHDDGQTWENVSGPIDSLRISALIAHPYHDGHLVFGTGNGKIFHTTDDGTSWSELQGVFTRKSITSFLFGGEKSNKDSLVHDSLFVGTDGDGVFCTSNYGQKWDTLNGGLADRSILSLAKTSSGEILVGTLGGGVFRLTNKGYQWLQTNNGYEGLSIRQIATDSMGSLYVVTSDNGGIFRSTDLGDSWFTLNNEENKTTGINLAEFNPSSIAIKKDGTIFIGDQNSIYRSTNYGISWMKTPFNLPNGSIRSFAVDPLGTIFGGHDNAGIVYSNDNGLSWEHFNGNLQDTSITALLAASESVLLAGTYNRGRIYRSTDEGVSWQSVLEAPRYRWFSGFVLSPSNNHIFAANVGHGIYRSTDYGQTWLQMNVGLMDTQVVSIAVATNGDIYAGTFSKGLFISTDQGVFWSEINIKEDRGFIASITSHPDGYIFMADGLGKVFKEGLLLSAINKDLPPSQYALFQNYPNPFNPTTSIEYEVPSAEYVVLKIFNLLGEEIATLVHERKEPGRYSVQWDAGKYPSGIYFYQITAGSFTDTKKLLLVR